MALPSLTDDAAPSGFFQAAGADSIAPEIVILGDDHLTSKLSRGQSQAVSGQLSSATDASAV
jgi:hypothetical protein